MKRSLRVILLIVLIGLISLTAGSTGVVSHLEARDNANKGAVIHRSYLKK